MKACWQSSDLSQLASWAALSQRVAQAGAFTKGSVPSPCRQGAEEEAFGNFGNDFASKGHTDILTYYTTLRIQYNSIIFNVHTSFASCISCTSGAAMQASLLVAASALDTEAEKLKSGDWKGY